MDRLVTAGNSLADFLEAKNTLNQIYTNRDKFIFISYSGGIINHSQSKNSPQYNILIDIMFLEKEKATEDIIANSLLDIDASPFFDSCKFENMLKLLEVISTTNHLKSDTDDPVLIMISSEVKMSSNLGFNKKEMHNLALSVIVSEGKTYDNVTRKSIHPENLPNLNINKED